MATKVVLIGAGSYVFTPSTLHDLICDWRLPELELWLVDPVSELAERMAGVAQRMAESAGIEVKTFFTGDRREALPDADFVTCSVAVDGRQRREIDDSVSRKHGLNTCPGEPDGLARLSCTLRQVPLILEVCRDIEDFCPQAVLLNVTDPLPRLMSAILTFTKVRAFGLSNVAVGGLRRFEYLARLLHRDADTLRVLSAGTNHCHWLLEITDAATGTDLYPLVRETVARNGSSTGAYALECLNVYGRLPLAGNEHLGGRCRGGKNGEVNLRDACRGSIDDRQRRLVDLGGVVEGNVPWQVLLENRSWECPADMIHAMVTGQGCELPVLNVRNNGALSELSNDAIVEVPCRVEGRQVIPRPIGVLPERLRELLVSVSTINGMAARAAATYDRTLLHHCIDADPVISNKDGAHEAIEELILAHSDLLPGWTR